MARQETDREDLFAEALALVRRAEWCGPGLPAPLLLGERENGWFTVYIGHDCYYQFDAEDRLRRAYAAPALYRTQGATLARLDRDRTSDVTVLQRRDLGPTELAEFRTELLRTLQAVLQMLQQPGSVPRRSAGEPPEAAPALLHRLERILNPPGNAWLAPAIRGRR